MNFVELNNLSLEAFVGKIGPVFENSPWIADRAFAERPFRGLEELHGALCKVVRESGEEKQLALIGAHPDLVGRAALAGKLTPASASE